MPSESPLDYGAVAVATMTDGLVVELASGEIAFTNPAAVRILGLSREQIAGGNVRRPGWRTFREDGSLLSGDERPGAVALRTGQPVRDLVLGVQGPDGVVRWLSVTAVPIGGGEGRPDAVVSTFADITARREAEEALRESEERFRQAFDGANVGVCLVDLEGRMFRVNPRMCEIFGYEKAELEGMSVNDIALPESRDVSPAFISKARDGRVERAEFEKSYRHRDGRTVRGQVSSSLVRSRSGEPLYFISHVADLTQRKESEEALRRSEERYRFLTENAVDVIWTLDPATGRFTYVSPSVERLRGFTAEEVMAQSMAEAVTPESLERVLRGFPTVADTVEAGAVPGPIGVTRIDQPRKDGSIVATEVVTKHVRDGSGRLVEVLGVTRDLTERLEAEEAIRALAGNLERRVRERTAELEEANRELEAFSYSVAHELRTPLRAIDARAALVAEGLGARLDAEGRHHLADLRWNAQRMGRLIDDLLAFSRAGRTDLHLGRVDMAAAARAAFARVAPGPGSRAAVFVGDLPAVRGDRRLLQVVWENLLSNAVKFSASRERPEVRVEGSLAGGEALFEVRDNGVGFDMAHAGKLFLVFQRLHGVLEFEGTGVGLALVRRIVLRHGGRVGAEGKPGVGATFSFALPAPEA